LVLLERCSVTLSLAKYFVGVTGQIISGLHAAVGLTKPFQANEVSSDVSKNFSTAASSQSREFGYVNDAKDTKPGRFVT
jgi:hypothetical protein